MPDIALEHSDATELAELLTFLADWISSTDAGALADSLTASSPAPATYLTTLHADLQRFVFLLGASDGEDLFGHHNDQLNEPRTARP